MLVLFFFFLGGGYLLTICSLGFKHLNCFDGVFLSTVCSMYKNLDVVCLTIAWAFLGGIPSISILPWISGSHMMLVKETSFVLES